MKRFGSFKTAAGVVVLGALVAGVVAVATARAAPTKKNFTVRVAVRDNTVSHQTFTVTLKNDPSSNTTLGSANISPPAGFTFDTDPAKAGADQTGWSATVVGNVLQIRSASSSDALAPGHSMTAFVRVDTPALPTTGCNAAWSALAKQSNDFNGTNNWFTQLLTASDMQPLGSFVFAPVQSVVSGPNNTQIAVPQIRTVPPGSSTQISIKALDSCGNPDTDYSGATLNREQGFGLVNATFSDLTWSTKIDGSRVGSASLTPVDVEVGDQFTVDDSTTKISAKSVSTGGRPTFDVVETICSAGQSCIWSDKNKPISATSTVPTVNGNEALGLGYQPFSTSSVQCGTGTFTPVGDIVRIDPYNYDSASTLIIVITYDKSLVGTGPASTLNVCKTTANGEAGTWSVVSACGNTPVAPCVDVTKVSGGNFQATLYLKPSDPGSGGFKGG